MRAKCTNVNVEALDQANTIDRDVIHNTAVNEESIGLVRNARVSMHTTVVNGRVATTEGLSKIDLKV